MARFNLQQQKVSYHPGVIRQQIAQRQEEISGRRLNLSEIQSPTTGTLNNSTTSSQRQIALDAVGNQRAEARPLMNFLPQNPKTRKTVLIIIGAGLALVSFVFLYVTYFAPSPSDEIPLSVSGKKAQVLSEQAVKKIDRDISSIENELKDDFYKSLR